jgi:hypothetical protein
VGDEAAGVTRSGCAGTRDAPPPVMTTLTAGAGLHPRKLFVLKALYLYTIVGAGMMGLGILLAPVRLAGALGLPESDPFLLGIVGATFAAFAICAALGLRAPVRFAPIVLLQLLYKILWLGLVFAPYAAHGAAPAYAWMFALVFASYVVLDVIALLYARLASDEP